MAGLRRSARLSGQSSSPATGGDVTSVGVSSKHKAHDTEESPKLKRSRNAKESAGEKHAHPRKDSGAKESAADGEATVDKADKLKRE